ncbi:RnfH family protein [Psychrobacter sp.]|uniref:RnfH family protein n=1 Tax=Psychrobacter sp. TaxID=56811 RepID=UPI0025F73243|nr:RnfH family protein [Psychrobacter sp.]
MMVANIIGGANDKPKIPISLAYAPSPTKSVYIEIEVCSGTTILQALQQVGWMHEYPFLKQWCEQHKDADQVDNKSWLVGIFSQKKPLNYVLKAHDRIEIYRPLTIDPMRKRKKRAVTQ